MVDNEGAERLRYVSDRRCDTLLYPCRSVRTFCLRGALTAGDVRALQGTSGSAEDGCDGDVRKGKERVSAGRRRT